MKMENIVKKRGGKYQFVKGKNVLWSRRKFIHRAGVILYFVENDEYHFIMGLDKNFREWTDFGGSVDNHENGAETALREMEEETLGIFDDLIDSDWKKIIHDENTVGIIEKSMVVLFIQLPITKDEFTNYKLLYQEEVEKRNQVVENIEIEAFTLQEFKAMVKQEREGFPMYKIVSQHLNKRIFDLIHWASPKIYSPK